MSLTQKEADKTPDFEIEDLLEPGFELGGVNIIDKNAELDHIRKHPNIPENLKPKLLDFLEQNPELFSGEEFSTKHFPSEIYEHDVELTQPLAELKAKPFPCSGIRLQQLKEYATAYTARWSGPNEVNHDKKYAWKKIPPKDGDPVTRKERVNGLLLGTFP